MGIHERTIYSKTSDQRRNPLRKSIGVMAFLFLEALCISGIVGCIGNEWIEVRCPEEHTAIRLPRDPTSTYRHYGSIYESGYRASEAALNLLIPGLSPGDTLKIVTADFVRYLAGERSAVQVQLEQSVARLQTNPCDDEARKRFQFLIQYVNFNGNYLHRIASACKDTSAILRSMLEEYRQERE